LESKIEDMEVLMRRQRGQTSRILGVVLIGTLGAGVFMGVRQLRQGEPVAKAEPAQTGQELSASIKAAAKAAPAPAPRPAVVAAPTTRPATVMEVTIVAPTTRPVIAGSTDPLVAGRAAFDAGQWVRARQLLSDALHSGRLSAAETQATREVLSQISQATIFSRKAFGDDPQALTYAVKPGDRLTSVAAAHGVSWELLCRINGISDPRKVRAGQTMKIINGPFHAVVNKSKFRMDIYLGLPGEAGSAFVASYPVGLGRDDSTPVGTWLVEPHKKLKNPTYFSPRGGGVIEADDPKNPLGEYWIGLSGVNGQAMGKQSYGIHGTIEPDTIGKEASMGCIRMRNEDVVIVFELLVEGKSTVVVKE
jgi:lipoprotein-anchoring transpeptidase ErfK/SrfK